MYGLAVEVDVQTFDFHFPGDAHADDDVDHLQDDEGADAAIDEHRGDIV